MGTIYDETGITLPLLLHNVKGQKVAWEYLPTMTENL